MDMKGSKDLLEHPVKVWVTEEQLEAIDFYRRRMGRMSRSAFVRMLLSEPMEQAQREFFMNVSAERASA